MFLSPGVEAISLPDPTQNYDNVEALVTGWGKNSTKGQLSDILQKVRVRTMSNEECQNKLRNNKITTVIKDYMLCTFEPGKGYVQVTAVDRWSSAIRMENILK